MAVNYSGSQVYYFFNSQCNSNEILIDTLHITDFVVDHFMRIIYIQSILSLTHNTYVHYVCTTYMRNVSYVIFNVNLFKDKFLFIVCNNIIMF